MALNGGVSLAVWMGGCAVELDCARRAHIAAEDAGTVERPAHRRVYNAICDAFDRRFVVDIMSGASAGGINGALLAGTARAGRRLPPELLRTKWLELGDFSRLLYGMNDPAPDALMKGKPFRDDLEGMFHAVLGTEKAKQAERDATAPPPGQEQLEPYQVLLDVTMTNVAGEPRSFVDEWNGKLSAREYRGVFRFRKQEDFTAETLAVAARTSASFPTAFPPSFVAHESAALAGVPGNRWAIDGGLLENAPIRAALDLIPSRPAARQVKRFVCYMNADPPAEAEVGDVREDEPPDLATILGHVVNIPRNARFVDQLAAVEAAKRRAVFSGESQRALLTVDLASLKATAGKLLEPYASRRLLLSLEDVLGDPGDARLVFDRIERPAAVPWIPDTIDPPSTPAGWRWGVRAAERILYLELDVLRDALACAADDKSRDAILDARVAIDGELTVLEDLHARFSADPDVRTIVLGLVDDPEIDAELAALASLTAEYGPPVVGAVRAGTEALARVAHLLKAGDAEALFGGAPAGGRLSNEAFRHLLERTLAVEVVRRAFFAEEAIDTGQQLRFAQLTPVTPTWIFAATPFRNDGPNSPKDKLTGILLGHFSGFYRRAWRANDFMWGRLDAATRIVDMLVDAPRAKQVSRPETLPADVLADALVPAEENQEAAEHRWLVHEALADARNAPAVHASVREALAAYPADGEPPVWQELRAAAKGAMRADLASGGTALLTRVLCTRAAQLEIVRQELPVLVDQSRGDRELGCFTEPLTYDVEDELRTAIEELRGCTLPKLLGRDSADEAASNLALGTVAHASFVGIAMLRRSLPLSRALAVVRAPLLPVAGVASRKLWVRAAVVVGFASAALYLAARMVNADATGEVPLGAIWSPPVWLMWLAALVIAGTVLVPALRALRSDAKRWRIEQGLWTVALLAAGAGVVVALAKWAGGLGLADLLVAPARSGENPPGEVVWLAIGVILGMQVLRIPFLPGKLAVRATALLRRAPLSLVVVGAALATLWWSVPELWDALRGGATWERSAAVAAFASVPVCLAYLFFGNRR